MEPTLLGDNAKLQLLKNAITADPLLNGLPNNSDGWFEIAIAFNQSASPSFWTWNMQVPITTLMQNGFDWTIVDNLTQGKARIWEWMTAALFLNFNKANVRAGIEAAFSTASTDAMRLSIYQEAQRLATRAEKLYTTGTGTTTNNHGVGPATAGNSGQVTSDEVAAAKALP